MKSSRIFSWFGFLLLAVVLGYGFFRVMEIRFSGGEIYPHYSTQRSDPLGAQALFDSFLNLEGFEVSRNFELLTQIKELDQDTALVLLGVPQQSINDFRAKDDSPVIKAVEEDGARLVLTFNPRNVPARFTPSRTEEEKDWFDRRQELREKRRIAEEREERENEKKDGKSGESDNSKRPENSKDKNEATKKAGKVKKGGEKGKDGEEEKDKDAIEEAIDEWMDFDEEEFEEQMEKNFGTPIVKRWGLDFAEIKEYKERPEGGWELVPGKDHDAVDGPVDLPNWFSQFRFEVAPGHRKDWKIVATVDGQPVVMERKLGNGSIVATSDSFFASNESLHQGGNAEFLLWLLGGKTRVVFDETVHGSTRNYSAMQLVRRYRIHGFFVGLFILVGLWAWRSASSLAPGSEEIEFGLVGENASSVAGTEANSGLVRLLERSIPAKKIMARCAHVWGKSKTTSLPPAQKTEMDRILASHEANPREMDAVSAYRRLIDLVKKRS
ncbi:MAG: hypothetical protein HKN23_11555 [Verrucomicrobiales bacterium]|nr:hypothetical protein [Verrucomicrobiales bacterium]